MRIQKRDIFTVCKRCFKDCHFTSLDFTTYYYVLLVDVLKSNKINGLFFILKIERNIGKKKKKFIHLMQDPRATVFLVEFLF